MERHTVWRLIAFYCLFMLILIGWGLAKLWEYLFIPALIGWGLANLWEYLT